MIDEVPAEKLIKIQLVIRNDCRLCEKVEKVLITYCSSRDYITLEIVDLDNGDRTPTGGTSYITPAIWVNNRLWSFGEINIARFNQRIQLMLASKQHLI